MKRTTLYAAVVTMFAAAPTFGGETSPGRDAAGEAGLPAQEVKDVASMESDGAARQARARRAPSQRPGGEDRSAERGEQSAQTPQDRDQRAADELLRQQAIWTAP